MHRRSLLVLAASTFTPLARADLFGSPAVVGSGIRKLETRDVGPFTGVALALNAVVGLRQGDKDAVVVEADDNILPLVETVVDNGTLTIRFRKRTGTIRANVIRVNLTARTIEFLAVAGTGDIHAGKLQARSLAAKVSGSGDIRIGQLDAASFKASISGSGNLTVAGRTDALQASIAGSGNLLLDKLETRSATLKIAGSGYAKVWARETLTVNVAGSGDVDYYGSPVLTRSVAGSGTIKRLGAAPA